MATSSLQILLSLRDQASQGLKNVEKATGGLHSKMLALAGVATAAVGAFVSFRTLEGIINTTQQLGEAVHDMGEQTGLSAENSSRLIFALKASGVELDKGSTALARFAKNMFAVTVAEDDGSKSLNTNQKILAGLGVTATETTGQMRPLGDILMDLADKISAMGDSGTKTALVLSLFGKGGLPMLEFLNQGSAGIKALSDEADRLGLTLSGDNVAKIHAFTVAHREMDAAIGGLKLQIGVELLPQLTKMTRWFIENQPRMREFVSGGIDKVREGLADAAPYITIATEGMRQLGGATINFGQWVLNNQGALVVALVGIGTAMSWAEPFNIAVAAFAASSVAASLSVGAMGDAAADSSVKMLEARKSILDTKIAAGELALKIDTLGLYAIPGFGKALEDFINSDMGGNFSGLFHDAGVEIEGMRAEARALDEQIAIMNWDPLVYYTSIAAEQFYALAIAAGVAMNATGDLLTLQGLAFQTNPELQGPPVPIGFKPPTPEIVVPEALLDLPNAAGSAAKALTAEQEALLGLMNALASANMTGAQFVKWQIDCQNAAAYLTEAAKTLGVTFEDMVDAFLRSGLAASEFGARITALTALKDLQAQAEDANDAVNNLYDSFNNLFSKPTVEGAAQKQALDQLKLQRAELVAAAGGKVSEYEQKQIDKVDDQIAAIQRDIDVRRAEEEVMKDGIVARDATKLTDEGLAWAVGALTEKMGPLSTTAADFNTQLFWATASLMDTTTWFQKLTGGVGDAWRAFKRFLESTPGEREALAGASAEQLAILWQGGKAPSFQLGGVMPFTGLAHLEAGERIIPASRQLTAGESKRTLNFYAPITVQMPAGASSLEEELARILR